MSTALTATCEVTPNESEVTPNLIRLTNRNRFRLFDDAALPTALGTGTFQIILNAS